MFVAEKGMIKFTFRHPAKVHSVDLDNTMGVSAWAAFAGSDENVVVDGDFAVTENELRTVLKSLREAGIAAHMTGEEPRIIFFHYWGVAQLRVLPKAFRKLCLLETEIPAKPRPNVR